MESFLILSVVHMFDPLIVAAVLIHATLIRRKSRRLLWVPVGAVASNLLLHIALGAGVPSAPSLAGSILLGIVVAAIFSRAFSVDPDHN